ncbi:hypothetical protein [Algoriphagus antarcticus]|uniref:hypothetical protein n=1 Tax=Algoriphagus antarcticus TaxID=238540 RepID=UPI000E25818F|nr:hypothetical protein [Algoriphagus antarcticus]
MISIVLIVAPALLGETSISLTLNFTSLYSGLLLDVPLAQMLNSISELLAKGKTYKSQFPG